LHDEVVEMIASVRGPVSAFARQSYQTHGRGVTLIALPPAPLGVRVVVSTQMVYYTAAQFELIFNEFGNLERVAVGDTRLFRSDAHMIVRMIESYDPSTQAVVTVIFGSENTVTVKMKLERPLLIDERPRIH
jgi:hypothetical protein